MPKRFTTLAAPPERPLPLWILYPLFFVAVYLTHYSLLRLPWFWDEAGYYIPAAIDFFRTGALIPHSTLTNAHPPLPSILIAGWWRIAGTSIEGTRIFLCMVSAAALLGVFRLARLLAGVPVAITTTLLTALYPIWFTQSTLAHADLFAATLTLWALSFYFEPKALPRTQVFVALLFSLAVLSKETAIVNPIALALWELSKLIIKPNPLIAASEPPRPSGPLGANEPPATARPTGTPRLQPWASPSGKIKEGFSPWGNLFALLFPILPLIAWYAYHHHATGFTFGNPEFLRYNATANLTPARIALSFWHRIVHLTYHMDLFVPIICAIAVLPMIPRERRTSLPLIPIALLLLANALAFSVLGGALLTRYLLPMYPLTLLVCVKLWHERLKQWPYLAALSAVAFIAALTINPPYSFAPEDNLTYRDFVTLHQRAIALIASDFPNAQVLTAWPATTELEHPDLGYTRRPIDAIPIDNFSLEEITKAAQDPGAFDTALVFSTKWTPSPGHFSFGRHTESTDIRFFDFHRDLTPPEIARLLKGQVVWHAESHGEWIAILRFPRASDASLHFFGR